MSATSPEKIEDGVEGEEASSDIRELEQAPPKQEIIERLQPYVRAEMADQAATVVQSMLVQQHHSGPLPPAREFRIYESVLPGAADRIIALAEREQGHRHDLEKTVVRAEAGMKGRGQWFALTALLASLLVVALFAMWGHAAAGATLGSAVIVGVVALFLGQKWSAGNEKGDEKNMSEG